jgi:hypothetical protein
MRSSGLPWQWRWSPFSSGTCEKGYGVTQQLSKGGRLQISIIALVFFGPLIVATWMYMSGRLQPEGRTNHGELLLPAVNLGDVLGESPILGASDAPWRLVYANEAVCDDPCVEALYRLRQIRLMLGKDMDRVGRIFLHGDSAPDKVFLDEQHQGLITITDMALSELLEERRPKEVPPGGIYLVDPLDNLIMYFSPDILPGDMADDVEHLLELSRIG